MANIALHTPITYVFTKDGECLRTTIPLDVLHRTCESSKFILIDGVMVNTYEIQKATSAKADDIEIFILSQTKDTQAKIQKRISDMKELGKTFDNVSQIIAYLEYKKIPFIS